MGASPCPYRREGCRGHDRGPRVGAVHHPDLQLWRVARIAQGILDQVRDRTPTRHWGQASAIAMVFAWRSGKPRRAYSEASSSARPARSGVNSSSPLSGRKTGTLPYDPVHILDVRHHGVPHRRGSRRISARPASGGPEGNPRIVETPAGSRRGRRKLCRSRDIWLKAWASSASSVGPSSSRRAGVSRDRLCVPRRSDP